MKRPRHTSQAIQRHPQSPTGIQLKHTLNAAGIDIGAQELVAAVPADSCEGPQVRTFSSFTSGVEALRDWLLQCKITTVAMESTGNYWITTYAILEDAGITVCLVNARHVKGVPGKKTDVCDALWLQQLHSAGLLKKSFRPNKDIIPMRYLMRHRGEMIQEGARQLHLMAKVLTEMNLHIHHVFSDIDGHSAQAIISAILNGERNPKALAKLRDPRCRSPEAKIIEALKGDYRTEYLFVLRQTQQRWQQCQQAIVECDQHIATLIQKVPAQTDQPLPPAPPGTRRKTYKHTLNACDIYQSAYHFYAVDLSAIPGVGSGLLSTLMSELGTGPQIRAAFRSSQAFVSWMGLCPDNRISGGQVLKAKTRKVPNRIAAALRLCAQNLSNSHGKLGELCRRMKGRLGKAEGIVAVAHKLARIIYGMITNGKAYDESTAFQVSRASTANRLTRLAKQAASLGYTLTPTPSPT